MALDEFRVALADGLRHEYVIENRGIIEAAGAKLDVVESPSTDDEAVERLQGYQVIVWPHGPYRLSPFDRLPDVFGVVAPTVGVDHVDVEAATAAGIVVGYLPTFATEQTADIGMFLLLGAMRRVPHTLAAWRDGKRKINEWEAEVQPIGEMRGAVLSLIGFGRIARAVAMRAAPFGMRMLAYAPTVSKWETESYGVRSVDLETAFREADAVSLHLPATSATHHFVDAELLGLMKPTAVLINVARGPVVDEAALLEALRSGTIAGAGLDVFESEPPAHDDPLVNLPNVIWTPHAGGSTRISVRRTGEGTAEQVADLARGSWPRHVVNPGVQPRVPLRPRTYPAKSLA